MILKSLNLKKLLLISSALFYLTIYFTPHTACSQTATETETQVPKVDFFSTIQMGVANGKDSNEKIKAGLTFQSIIGVRLLNCLSVGAQIGFDEYYSGKLANVGIGTHIVAFPKSNFTPYMQASVSSGFSAGFDDYATYKGYPIVSQKGGTGYSLSTGLQVKHKNNGTAFTIGIGYKAQPINITYGYINTDFPVSYAQKITAKRVLFQVGIVF